MISPKVLNCSCFNPYCRISGKYRTTLSLKITVLCLVSPRRHDFISKCVGRNQVALLYLDGNFWEYLPWRCLIPRLILLSQIHYHFHHLITCFRCQEGDPKRVCLVGCVVYYRVIPTSVDHLLLKLVRVLWVHSTSIYKSAKHFKLPECIDRLLILILLCTIEKA